MRDKTSSSEAAWQEEELSAAGFPDKRLARRLRRLLDQMSAAPGRGGFGISASDVRQGH